MGTGWLGREIVKREKVKILQFTVLTVVFLRYSLFFIYYITIYILISYRIFRNGVYPLFLIVRTVIVRFSGFDYLLFYKASCSAAKGNYSHLHANNMPLFAEKGMLLSDKGMLSDEKACFMPFCEIPFCLANVRKFS